MRPSNESGPHSLRPQILDERRIERRQETQSVASKSHQKADQEMSPYVSYYVCDGCGAKIPEKAHIIKDDGLTNVNYWEQRSKQYFLCDLCYQGFLHALATIIATAAIQK
jgi:hypothetical protein